MTYKQRVLLVAIRDVLLAILFVAFVSVLFYGVTQASPEDKILWFIIFSTS